MYYIDQHLKARYSHFYYQVLLGFFIRIRRKRNTHRKYRPTYDIWHK